MHPGRACRAQVDGVFEVSALVFTHLHFGDRTWSELNRSVAHVIIRCFGRGVVPESEMGGLSVRVGHLDSWACLIQALADRSARAVALP